MAHTKKEKEREHRIDMEIVVDCYDDNERAMGWYCYLEDTLKFPFKARCKSKRAISPLKVGSEVEILALASDDVCCHEIFVVAKYLDGKLAVPLDQLEPLAKDKKLQEAVTDWHYWVDQGYEF